MVRTLITKSLVLCVPLFVDAQVISGKVTDENGHTLQGATVYCPQSQFGTVTGEEGDFSMDQEDLSEYTLVFQFVGMLPDTFEYRGEDRIDIRMRPANVLDGISVNARKQGSFVASTRPVKTEVINEVELSRAACCDLAGCFGTEASVHSATTNIVTNTKELRILGLSGVYNQLLVDGFPLLQGASYTYGISSIPGTLVDNIYIAKGANSVLQGYESISGQINVTRKDPAQSDNLLLNGYVNSFGEKQFNINYAHQGDTWSSMTALHTTQPADRIDGDGDNFMDLPLLSRYSLYNAWKQGNEAEWGPHTLVGFRYVDEKRIGGQLNYDPDIHGGGKLVYGQQITYRQPEVFLKTGFRLDDTHHWLFIASGYFHNQLSQFGTLQYDARQKNAYANFQYEYSWKDKNVLKTGTSLRFNQQDEEIFIPAEETFRNYGGNYVQNQVIPGLFAENTWYTPDDKWTIITGIRLDHHNKFGFYFTPRALVRVQAAKQTTMRFSVGTGWRTAFVFSEQVQLLASSRNVIFQEELNPEKAFNIGFNVVQNLSKDRWESYFSLDAYHTTFINQIFPDYFQDGTTAYLYNFKGTSISNGVKGELNLALDQVYTMKLAYNFLDVFRKSGNIEQDIPFVARHAALASFSYRPLHNEWQFDLTLNWTGKQRLADTGTNPEIYQRPEFSSPFSRLDVQFLKRWPTVEVYAGCENLFGFRQKRPIISWEDPFGRYFDTASVWGPTRGREFYLGVRYRMNREGAQ